MSVSGLLLIGAGAATAFAVALSCRLPSLTTTLLVAYLALVANFGLVTLVLSPFHEVTRIGLGGAEAVLLAAALGGWWLRGAPRPPLAGARVAARELVSDRLTLLFLVLVAVMLVYELVLVLTVPPSELDALTYHLVRAAAWAQHRGMYWVADAPTVRINAFQPLAEQQLLFLFVATGTGALYALPQYLAEIAILLAVYGSARRLGFPVRPSACASALFATFSLVALEATTGLTDLVAASFPAVAACLLLGGRRLEAGLAGAAVAFGLATKLTTGLVLPVLLWLALARGRRTATAAIAGGVLGFAGIGIWGYVLNLVHSGHLLGVGTGQPEDRGSPSYPGSVANAFYLLYSMMDLSVLSNDVIVALTVGGLVAAVIVIGWAAIHRRGIGQTLAAAAGVATPLLAPGAVVAAAAGLALLADRWGFPIEGAQGIIGPLHFDLLTNQWRHIASADFSAYGPIGIVSILAAMTLTIGAYLRGRADSRQLALALALPGFLLLEVLLLTWNPYITRFVVVPAVLVAPLLARLFRDRSTTAAYLTVAALTGVLTVTGDQSKPLANPYGYGPPWDLTQLTSLITNSRGRDAGALQDYDRLVPPSVCVGVVVTANEPSYLLYGATLDHHVVYLPASANALQAAYQHGLYYVVISSWEDTAIANVFREAHWRMQTLGGYWILASAQRVTTSVAQRCS
jgi:hypothetical protein